MQTKERALYSEELGLVSNLSSLLRKDGKCSLQYVKGALQFIDKNMEQRLNTASSSRRGELARTHSLREKELQALKSLKQSKGLLEVCEHHFHSARRQHTAREELETRISCCKWITQRT